MCAVGPALRGGIFLFFSRPPHTSSQGPFGLSKHVQWEIKMPERSRPWPINYLSLSARGVESTRGTAGLKLTPPSGQSVHTVCIRVDYSTALKS